MVPREKMESMANEYTYLLTSQLEGQRRYFEEQVERAVDKASEASSKAEAAAAQAVKATSDLAISQDSFTTMQATLTHIEKALEKSEKSRSKFEDLSRNLSSQLREEKTINSGLMERIKAADKKAEDAKTEAEKAREEKRELEDMNHDLTMFISSQEKVKELQAQGEEVVEGGVGVVEKPGGGKKGKGRKR
jgi:BRCA1-associated protein